MQFVVSTKENSRLRACKYTYCMIYNSVYYSVLIYCVAWIGATSIPSTFYLSIWYNVLLLQLNLYIYLYGITFLLLQLNLYLFQFHRFIYNTTYIYMYCIYIYGMLQKNFLSAAIFQNDRNYK